MATAISQTTIRETEKRWKQVRNARYRQNAGRLLLHAILLVSGFFWVYPFLWALGSSLKSEAGFFNEGLSFIPKEFQWSNYADAWTGASFGQYFFNTVIITVLTVAFTLT